MLTGLPRVHDEAGVVEGRPLDQAVAMSFDLTGITDLRLNHHDGDGTVGDVAAVLQNADPMLTHLAGDEGDTWEGERGGGEKRRRVGGTSEKLLDVYLRVTDVVVGQSLQQTGLVTAGWRLDAGGQEAQVRLIDVQREICRRAQFDLRAALVVL